jgi:hypothetical protein
MRKILVAIAALVALAVIAAPAGAKVDKDCSDFPTQKAAQKWFKKHNPKADPSRLDADHDGIACEDNPRVMARRGSPPNVVGLRLPLANERLRAAGWIPKPFNTDTILGIIVPSHYTVCKEYPPIGRKVRILAQKYGC